MAMMTFAVHVTVEKMERVTMPANLMETNALGFMNFVVQDFVVQMVFV